MTSRAFAVIILIVSACADSHNGEFRAPTGAAEEGSSADGGRSFGAFPEPPSIGSKPSEVDAAMMPDRVITVDAAVLMEMGPDSTASTPDAIDPVTDASEQTPDAVVTVDAKVDASADAAMDAGEQDSGEEPPVSNPFCSAREPNDAFCQDGGNIACVQQEPASSSTKVPNGCRGLPESTVANCATVEELAEQREIETVEDLLQYPATCSWDILAGVELTLKNLCLAYEQRRYKAQRCQELVMEIDPYRENEYQWTWRADVPNEVQLACLGSNWAYVTDCTDPSRWRESCVTRFGFGSMDVSLPYCWTGDPALAPDGVSVNLRLTAASWCTSFFSQQLDGMNMARGPGRDAFLALGPHVCDGVLPARTE